MEDEGSVLRLAKVLITGTFAALGSTIDAARSADSFMMENSTSYKSLANDNLVGSETRNDWTDMISDLLDIKKDK